MKLVSARVAMTDIYFELCTTSSTKHLLYTLPHWILTINLGGQTSFHSTFTNVKTELTYPRSQLFSGLDTGSTDSKAILLNAIYYVSLHYTENTCVCFILKFHFVEFVLNSALKWKPVGPRKSVQLKKLMSSLISSGALVDGWSIEELNLKIFMSERESQGEVMV